MPQIAKIWFILTGMLDRSIHKSDQPYDTELETVYLIHEGAKIRKRHHIRTRLRLPSLFPCSSIIVPVSPDTSCTSNLLAYSTDVGSLASDGFPLLEAFSTNNNVGSSSRAFESFVLYARENKELVHRVDRAGRA